MAKSGKRFTFHGAFKTKRNAVAKERKVKGFVLKRKIGKATRYLVLRPRKK